MTDLDMTPPRSPARPVVTERAGRALPGFVGALAALAAVALLPLSIALIVRAEGPTAVAIVLLVICPPLVVSCTVGQYLVQPNQTLIVILFGRYRGTLSRPGWWWTPNPFTRLESRKISMRIHNFTTPTSKVNDAKGNPIEIAAVVVWQVDDSARAVFEVDDYLDFVEVQSETAIRHLGTQYPYDDLEGDGLSLRANPDEVAHTLHTELEQRLAIAGIRVNETRLTHLAYATEIAEAMLRRQQAVAIVAARRKIVEGAVGMVQDALGQVERQGIAELDEERKAAMVSNLLVVLTSEQATTPVVNVGSLY